MEYKVNYPHQKDLYSPTKFWHQACRDLELDIKKNGLENFRRLTLPLNFFVPTYGYFTNCLFSSETEKMLKTMRATPKHLAEFRHFLSGEMAALADYRTFKAGSLYCNRYNFHNFSESCVGNPIEQFCFDSKFYSRASLNYLLGLSFLSKFVDLDNIKIILEIGGGFGSLGEITRKCMNETKYIDLDIYPVDKVAKYYLKKTFNNIGISSSKIASTNKKISIRDLNLTSILPSWQIENLEGEVDLFVNFISFQEMEPEIVTNYLEQISRLKSKWILLRNLREGKPKATETMVGVKEPVFGIHYAKMLPAYELLDKNVTPFGHKTVDGFHSELLLFRRNA